MQELLESILSAQEHALGLITGARRIEEDDSEPYLEVFDPKALFKEVEHSRDIMDISRKKPVSLEQISLESFYSGRADKVLKELPESLCGDKELLKLTLTVLLLSS